MPTILPILPLQMPTGGVRKDLPRRSVPPNALAEAENFIVLRGGFRVRPGLSSFADGVSQRIMGIAQYNHEDEANRLVIGTTLGWWRWDVSDVEWVDISGTATTGTQANHVIFRTFNKGTPTVTYLIGVNGKDHPKKWTGEETDDYAELGGSPPDTAKSICVCFSRVILLAGRWIYISAINDFDSGWGTELVKLLIDTPGDGVAVMEFGVNQFLAYKTDAIYVGIPVAGAQTFQINPICTGIVGPCSPAAVVPLPDGSHAYLGHDGQVYIFSGMRPVPVGPHIQEWVAGNADLPSLTNASGFHDPVSNVLWFFYPSLGYADCNRAIAIQLPDYTLWPMIWTNKRPTVGRSVRLTAATVKWNEAINTWAQQELTWAAFDRTGVQTIIGEHDGEVFFMGGNTDDSDAIPAYFETGLLDGGDPSRHKTLTEIDHLATSDGIQAVSVRVGVSDHGEDRVLEPPVTLTVSGAALSPTGHRVTGIAFSHRWEVLATKALAYLGGGMEMKIRGRR